VRGRKGTCLRDAELLLVQGGQGIGNNHADSRKK
jgi:hypothetical protein